MCRMMVQLLAAAAVEVSVKNSHIDLELMFDSVGHKLLKTNQSTYLSKV